MTPKEFDMKHTFTIGFLVWTAMVSFSLGILYSRIMSHTDDISAARTYTTQEVDGLRSDWERDRKEQERRLNKLETYHVK